MSEPLGVNRPGTGKQMAATVTQSLYTKSLICQRLAAGRPVLALGVRFSRTPDIARMAWGANYDVLWIDLEHSSMSVDSAAGIAATATDLGLSAWVRIPERDYGLIGRALDGGATGIIAPKIESASEARIIADACRFPPVGIRSMLASVPQFGFKAMSVGELVRQSNDAITVQVIIESAKGVENVSAIAAVPGLDVLAVGMNDLTADLGCPGEVDHPSVVAACAAVAKAAAGHQKLAIIGGVGARFPAFLAQGFAPFVFCGIDTDVMAEGLKSRAIASRSHFADSVHTDSP